MKRRQIKGRKKRFKKLKLLIIILLGFYLYKNLPYFNDSLFLSKNIEVVNTQEYFQEEMDLIKSYTYEDPDYVFIYENINKLIPSLIKLTGNRKEAKGIILGVFEKQSKTCAIQL